MDANDMFVNDAGQLILRGVEIHPCCLEAVDFGHGDCEYAGFVNMPKGKAAGLRAPIPVKETWRGRPA